LEGGIILKSSTVNISFKKDLLTKIDEIAQEESRSRSELIREAARLYIEKKNRWKEIFEYGENRAAAQNIKEDEILKEIKQYRKEKQYD